MNAATRGVILVVVAVALGVIILGQGFDDPDTVVAAPAPAASDDGSGDDGSGDGTAPADDSGADTAADGGSGADDGTADADSGADDRGGDDTTGDDTGTETPTTPPDDGPPDILHSPTEVRVLVVNGTTVQGAAGTINNQLIALGFNGLPPTNTEPVGSATETVVYYEEGFLLDAQDLALQINASAAAVQPIPAEVPVADLAEANVVIILGPDLASPG